MKRFFHLGIIFCLFSCIDEIPFRNSPNTAEGIIIDGFISDRNEPYVIRISKPVSLTALSNNFLPIENAQVSIETDSGEEIILSEESPGLYQTDTTTFIGEVGRSYRLNVRVDEAELYQSSWERMLPGVDIDSLYFEVEDFVELFTNLNGDFRERDRNRLKLLIELELTNSTKFYRIRTRRIQEILTETFVCCAQCWRAVEFPDSEVILINGSEVLGNQVVTSGIVPYTQLSEYFVEVQLLSLSEEGFNFWNQIAEQREIQGSIFDPIPSIISGNISSVNSDKSVTGYFGASSISKKSIIIDRASIDIPRKQGRTLTGDCRLIPGATTVRPDEFN